MRFPMREVVSSFSPWGIGTRWRTGGGGISYSTLNYPVSNLAIFVPLTVTEPYTVRSVWWGNGTTIDAGSDIDSGVWDITLNRLVSCGTTAQSGAGAIQKVSVSNYTLDIGRYWMVFACDDTGTDIYGCTMGNIYRVRDMGVMQQTGTSQPLPDTTLSPTSAAYDFVPLFGISSLSV